MPTPRDLVNYAWNPATGMARLVFRLPDGTHEVEKRFHGNYYTPPEERSDWRKYTRNEPPDGLDSDCYARYDEGDDDE